MIAMTHIAITYPTSAIWSSGNTYSSNYTYPSDNTYPSDYACLTNKAPNKSDIAFPTGDKYTTAVYEIILYS